MDITALPMRASFERGIRPILLVAFMFFSSAFGSCGGAASNDEHTKQIIQHRQERHEFMATSDASPFKGLKFSGLNYFEPDISFKVQAIVEKAEKAEYLEIPTSTGATNRYLKYGWASFKLKGVDCKLLLLKPVGIGSKTDMVFLTFNDLTNGEETYGGGRYIDLTHRNSPKLEIDFNKAYNPYCEYSPNFSCPIPPKENKLNLRVEAGEKRYIEVDN